MQRQFGQSMKQSAIVSSGFAGISRPPKFTLHILSITQTIAVNTE